MKIAVFTGAGISAESGIATFRDSNGLWNNHRPEDVATIDAWHSNPELLLQFYNERRAQLHTVHPNAAHFALAELEKDHEVSIITQNVDDLHERAGSTNILHLHGEIAKMIGENDEPSNPNVVDYPYNKDIKLGDMTPAGYQLRPKIVWFGEMVYGMLDAQQIVKQADVLIVIGTSLNVYPAASLTNLYATPKTKILVNKEQPSGMTVGDWITLIEPATTGVPKIRGILNDLVAK